MIVPVVVLTLCYLLSRARGWKQPVLLMLLIALALVVQVHDVLHPAPSAP